MNQFFIKLFVRLVAHGKIQPCLFVYNALVMGEGRKALPSVVGAHTALAKAAKAHLACGKVDDGVVDTAAAETAGGGYLFLELFVRGKEVQRKGMRHCVNLIDCMLQRIIGQDRKNGTEDFLLHHGICKSNIIQYCWCNLQSFAIGIAADYNFILIY